MHSDKMCYMSVYVACFKSSHWSIVRILYLVCCVHGGLNGGAHAFLDCGCQMVELMVLVDLKHPQHPPSLSPLPPASLPGLTGGACDSLMCHLWQLAEEHNVLNDWSSANVLWMSQMLATGWHCNSWWWVKVIWAQVYRNPFRGSDDGEVIP